jgi:hypothetical protein
MPQILFVGGKNDGEIEERDFVESKTIPKFNTIVVSNHNPGSAGSTTQHYTMFSLEIGEKRYAYAICKSAIESEIRDLIIASGLKPMN